MEVKRPSDIAHRRAVAYILTMARFPEARSDIGVPNTYYIVSIASVFGISLAYYWIRTILAGNTTRPLKRSTFGQLSLGSTSPFFDAFPRPPVMPGRLADYLDAFAG